VVELIFYFIYFSYLGLLSVGASVIIWETL